MKPIKTTKNDKKQVTFTYQMCLQPNEYGRKQLPIK